MTVLRRIRRLGENNLALKLFALALATLLYFAVRPAAPRGAGGVSAPTQAKTGQAPSGG